MASLIYPQFNSGQSANLYEITGAIKDKLTGYSLPYASIRIDNTTYGTASNNEGQFILKLKEGSYKLIFSYIGYKTDTLSIYLTENEHLDIKLEPQAVRLPEIVVNANEDPAYKIIREAIRRKKENRKGLISLEYNAYSKRILKSGGEVGMIEEVFVKGYSKVGEWEKEFILSRHKTENRKKQIRSMDFNISGNYYIDFSKDTLTLILNKVYLPLADKAFDYYDYKLMSVTETPTGEVYKIKVIPLSKIQPLLQGEIDIEGKNYALVKVNLRNNEGLRFLFAKDLNVRFVQQLGNYDGYWLPNYIETEAGFEFSFQGLISLDKIELEEISNVTEYKINPAIPDSIVDAIKSKYGGFTVDTTNGGKRPIELTRQQINELRPIPLTKLEIKAYDELDSTKTFEKIIKVKGPLASLVAFSEPKSDSNKSTLFATATFLTKYVNFANNRVDGISIGPRYAANLINDKLSLDFSSKYSFLRKKIEAEGNLNFRLEDFFVNSIEAYFYNKTKNWDDFSPYSEITNSISVTMGFDDQFNYYLSKGVGIALTKNFLKDIEFSLNFTSEQENSLKENKYQSILKSSRLPRENPAIAEGTDRRISVKISLGKNPWEFQAFPSNGLVAQLELSDPAFSSDFSYKRYHFTGLIRLKTFYKELFISPYLEIMVDAAAIQGSYGPQHLFVPNTALGFFAPLGVFKGLRPVNFIGTDMLAIHVEHNWRTVLFQALGLDFMSDLYFDFITGISLLKTWNQSNYLLNLNMNKPYWEVFASISKIFGIVRVDVSYNSFKNFYITSSFGVVL
ncbi:DUF5686 family protein [Melioribacteraceae bacterium 4301-Me]|uniref:DUF5686 and carboxypeptidase-like regulatory domain-containing protein n=1 Tax=Pyranulibacter aquaticus TaxID=3163344 RepID=UPI003598EAB9